MCVCLSDGRKALGLLLFGSSVGFGSGIQYCSVHEVHAVALFDKKKIVLIFVGKGRKAEKCFDCDTDKGFR